MNFLRFNSISEVGSSTNPCSEVYAGPSAFSEPEVRALANFIKTIDNLKMYLSFHAYSQLVLFPFVSLLMTENYFSLFRF